MELQQALTNVILGFGAFVYVITAAYCIFVTLIAQVTPSSTLLGKLIVGYGVFNTGLWGSLAVLLVLHKVGSVLLN